MNDFYFFVFKKALGVTAFLLSNALFASKEIYSGLRSILRGLGLTSTFFSSKFYSDKTLSFVPIIS